MSTFYIVSALLCILGLLFVVYPWLRRERQDNRLEVSNVSVIRARIDEIEREASEGLISEAEKRASIDEMKVALVDETKEDLSSSHHSSFKALFIGAIPTLAIGIWVYVDANQLSGLSQLQYALNNTQELNNRIVLQPANDVSPQEFQKYALVIRQQLREKPNDATGWTWLARINMTLGQMEESTSAFKKALALSPQDDDLRARYAQAAMMKGTEEGLEIANHQLSYLIKKTPTNREYRLLMTVVAAQLGNKEIAFTNFALIKDALDTTSGLFQSLTAQLRDMGAPEFLLQVNNDASRAAGVQAGPAQSISQNEAPVNLDILISLSDELQAKLPKTGFLIVFAQDASGQSRLPLAVKKLAIPDFPVTINLSEKDAMLENFSLKSAKQIKLTARISVDEDVMASSGELQGMFEQIEMSAKPSMVELIIDKELP